ncbi:unnamed protein product [Symbiodinium sp. CCMP2592]|nr:unnamed protein product [Symbiodinium sp. CCMP2592]
MQLHVSMLAEWLAGKGEIPDHHRSLPWRAIVSVNDKRFANFLQGLRTEWQFIQCLDRLPPKKALFKSMNWTRWPVVREMLTEAELPDSTLFGEGSVRFDPQHPDARKVQELCLASAGLRVQSRESSLLTSLPNELCFNDLRDAERRAQKNEMRAPTSICAGAIKSGWVRSPLEKVSLESQDWTSAVRANKLRSSILPNARSGKKDLGLNMTELTASKACPHMTKPHVLMQRLLFYSTLLSEFAADSSCNLEKMAVQAWAGRLMKVSCFWQPDDSEQTARFVVSTGPDVIRYVTVQGVEVQETMHFAFPKDLQKVEPTLRFNAQVGRLSLVVGLSSEEHGLLLRPEAWLSPIRFMLSHTILDMPAAFIAQFAHRLALVATRLRTRSGQLLLESENYPEDYIQNILENPPSRTRKARKPEEANEDKADDNDDDEEDEAEICEATNYMQEEENEQEDSNQESHANDARPSNPDGEAMQAENKADNADDAAAAAAAGDGHAVPEDRSSFASHHLSVTITTS